MYQTQKTKQNLKRWKIFLDIDDRMLCSVDQRQHPCSQKGTATCWENCASHQTHCSQGDFCEAEQRLEGASPSRQTWLSVRQVRHVSSIRLLYSVTDELMGRTTDLKLPPNIPLSDLPNAFSDFMHEKIANIRQMLDSCPVPASFEPFAGTGCVLSHLFQRIW